MLSINPFINPFFLIKVIRSHLSDVNRIWISTDKQLKAYQDKALRKIIRYAYDVPLYRDKFQSHGIKPNDIKGVDDIEKLPFISKNDLRIYYPDGIIPISFDKQHSFLVSTSGSTGKPVFLYHDMFSAIKSLTGFVRALYAYGGDWRKSRIVLIIDTSPGSAEHMFFTKSMFPFLKKFVSLDNIKYLHIGGKPEIIIEEINKFNPEFIGSDPNILRELAILKNKGYGRDINARYLFSAGAMLDNYTKMYVENAFNTKIFNTYGTTEAGPLAFECLECKYYHVNSDFVYLEFLDDENKTVSSEKPGRLVVTKLFGGGTPIIRYTGLEDIVTPIEIETTCGITTPMIKQIEGRSTDLIILPDGRTLSPLTVTGIPAKIMQDYNTYMIKQFQIIQHEVNKIEILVIIDYKLKNTGLSVKRLLAEFKKRFQDTLGSSVNIIVNEVKEIQKDKRLDYVKVAVSKVKHNI